MAKETTLTELREMIERGFKAVADDVADIRKDMATKEDVADIKTEMMEQSEHVEKQFHALDDRLRDLSSEIAVVHRRVERLATMARWLSSTSDGLAAFAGRRPMRSPTHYRDARGTIERA
jgi:hypothetical protein